MHIYVRTSAPIHRSSEVVIAYRIHQRNHAEDELTRQKTGRSDERNLTLLVNLLLQVRNFGRLMHTQPATLIQPVIQDKTGTQFGHETFTQINTAPV